MSHVVQRSAIIPEPLSQIQQMLGSPLG